MTQSGSIRFSAFLSALAIFFGLNQALGSVDRSQRLSNYRKSLLAQELDELKRHPPKDTSVLLLGSSILKQPLLVLGNWAVPNGRLIEERLHDANCNQTVSVISDDGMAPTDGYVATLWFEKNIGTPHHLVFFVFPGSFRSIRHEHVTHFQRACLDPWDYLTINQFFAEKRVPTFFWSESPLSYLTTQNRVILSR